MQAFKGQGPAPRYGHSATIGKLVLTNTVFSKFLYLNIILVGPTQRHVLIYGGRNMKTQSRNGISRICLQYLLRIIISK